MTMPKDPYLWLEDIDSEKSIQWVEEHNKTSLGRLQADPHFDQLRQNTLEIMSSADKIPAIAFGKNHVYNFWTDSQKPRGLYRRTTYAEYKKANPHWEILLDVDQLGKIEGKSWVFQGCQILKPEYRYCLMSLSDGGKDARVIREFDLKTKSFVQNGFFVPEAKSTVAWVDQNTLLVGSNFGPDSLTASGYPRLVKILKRGQSLSDAKKIFEVGPDDMGAYVYNNDEADSRNIFIGVNKDFYHHEHYIFRSEQEIVPVQIPETAQFYGVFKGEFYFSITHNWLNFKQGSLLKTKEGSWTQAQEVYVPNENSSFEGVSFSKADIYISVLENVNKKVYKADADKSLIEFPAPSLGSSEIAATDIYSDHALFIFESSLIPPTLFEWDGKAQGKITSIKSMPPKFNSQNLVLEQYFATSFDGVQIPYFIIRNFQKKGPQPTFMTAYGGFQIALYPTYEANLGKNWLEQGGQFVIANIRGGGEYGPRWHEAALKKNRQVAFNDLFAVTQDLFQRGFTTPAQLAMGGGSNGGLLAGVALTQKPEFYKAIIISVPLLDMLRYHKLLAGASWIGEYGNPDIDHDREYIQKYSPYQNLKSDQKYPEILLTTSTRDDRVHPGHARKFGAKLEELQVPFYYYENIEGGHAGAADLNQAAVKSAIQYTFLREQLMPSSSPLP
jgi:prolyl oligopeptidase